MEWKTGDKIQLKVPLHEAKEGDVFTVTKVDYYIHTSMPKCGGWARSQENRAFVRVCKECEDKDCLSIKE